MAKLHYIPYIQGQTILFPQRIDEDIADNDPVRVLNHIVDNLDLRKVKKLYRERGRSHYDPKMMLKIVLYAYMNNIYSCRKIEKLLHRDIHFMWLAASAKPDFITINRFHIEHRMHYAPNPFSADGMYYNADEDYYVCPMGQKMERIGTKRGKTESGYITESARYQAKNCSGCPLRGQCFKAKGNRVIEVNHRLKAYKKRAADLLTSEEGIKHRGRRCIEPESVFGQIKSNMAYRRFRHFGKDKITMDFSFFATAFNIKKLCKMLLNGSLKNLQTLIKLLLGRFLLKIGITNDFLHYQQIMIAA